MKREHALRSYSPETVEGTKGGDCVQVSAHNVQESAVWPTRVWLATSQAGRAQDIQARRAESMCFHCKVLILREKWASDRPKENEAISFPYVFLSPFVSLLTEISRILPPDLLSVHVNGPHLLVLSPGCPQPSRLAPSFAGHV